MIPHAVGRGRRFCPAQLFVCLFVIACIDCNDIIMSRGLVFTLKGPFTHMNKNIFSQ